MNPRMEDQALVMLTISASGPLRSTVPTSILDLPQSILDDVILGVRQIVRHDGYLCDLRLVSKQFNESVLHCLAFRGSLRNFRPPYYISCPKDYCRTPYCRDCGVCNRIYARIILQGKISSQRGQDGRLLKHYRTLGEAFAIFQKDVIRPGTSFEVTRSQLSNSNLFRCGSLNPIFADPERIIFCDAAVMLLRILDRNWKHRSWAQHDICHWNAQFWLKNLACYLGDAELLSQYSINGDTEVKSPKCISSEFEELLGLTATRGHEALFQKLLARATLQHTNLALALSGACYSGSTRILNMILDAVPKEQVPALCLQTLLRLRGSRRLPLGHSVVVEQIASRCKGVSDDRHLNGIFMALADLGAAQALCILIHRFRNRRLWPVPGYPAGICFSPLWSACVNGDLECVRVLLEEGYFTNTSEHEYIEDLCLGCAKVAVHSNSFSILQEIYRFLEKEVNDIPFQWLAAVDGSMEVMINKLTIEPDHLNEIPKFEYGESSVGQVALQRAALRLRVENVAFLLEKGIRPDSNECWEYFEIEWRYRRAHEQKYQEVQKLLKDYGVAQLGVEL